jgi:hypothetical protein
LPVGADDGLRVGFGLVVALWLREGDADGPLALVVGIAAVTTVGVDAASVFTVV